LVSSEISEHQDNSVVKIAINEMYYLFCLQLQGLDKLLTVNCYFVKQR